MKLARIPAVVLVILSAAAGAVAGPLASDIDTYEGIWHGSFALPFFDPPSGLQGYVDAAVYDPSHAPAGFAGYVRTPGEFIYTYQVYVTSGPAVIEFDVNVEFPADNLGSFTGTGVFGEASVSTSLVPFDHASWTFNGVDTGNNSIGLIFSSPSPPQFALGTAKDLDGFSTVTIVPSPSYPPPEPASLTLAAFALLGLAAVARRRRRAGAVLSDPAS